MNQQKRNRLVAAGTVSVVLLLLVIFGIMVYQPVVLVSLRNPTQELITEMKKSSQAIAKHEKAPEY